MAMQQQQKGRDVIIRVTSFARTPLPHRHFFAEGDRYTMSVFGHRHRITKKGRKYVINPTKKHKHTHSKTRATLI